MKTLSLTHMKQTYFFFTLLVFISSCSGQNQTTLSGTEERGMSPQAIGSVGQPPYVLNGRTNPSVKKEELNFVQSIDEVVPDLWYKLGLPYKERMKMDLLLGQQNMFFDSVLLDRGAISNAPRVDHNRMIDILSVEIHATCNGEAVISEGSNGILTTAQKNMLNTADLGSDIYITIKFRYKTGVKLDTDNADEVVHGGLLITVVPEKEAEYPGGWEQLTAYFMKSVLDKIPGTNSFEKIMGTRVTFTVDEEGRVVDTKISGPSADTAIDKLFLDAMSRMPRWKPAENSRGIKVKQEFNIPFGGGC